MRVMFARGTARDDFTARRVRVNRDLVNIALVMVLVRRLNGHLAAHDFRCKALQLFCPLANGGLDRRRWFEITEAYFQG